MPYYKKELEEIKRRIKEVATGTADVNYCNAKEIAEYIDPTLKRSEDEVMYDKLMHALDALVSYIDADAITADAQKPILIGEIESIRKWLVKKELTSATFKPRFKVGDWITNGVFTYMITGIDTYFNFYDAASLDSRSKHIRLVFSYYDENYHPWSIKDAKDGDIVTSKYKMNGKRWVGIFARLSEGSDDKFDTHCFISGIKHDFITDANLCSEHIGEDTEPASLNQREVLFQKMRDCGFTWDDEAKKLVKIHNE